MRIGKYWGEELRLKEDIFKSLRKRMDPKNAKLIDGNFYIKINCRPCKLHYEVDQPHCIGCPFNIFANDKYMGFGCLTVLRRIMGDSFRFLCVSRESLKWLEEYDKKVRKHLKLICRRFDRMKRI